MKPKFTLSELADIAGAESVGTDGNLKIRGISTDTRDIREGEVFLALGGENFNGVNFLEDAKKKRAIAAIVPKPTEEVKGLKLIRVENTKKTLSDIAKAHRAKFSIPVIGITGSNGKTTVKDMMAHILSKRFKVLATEENYNNKVGVAQALLKLDDHDIAIIEVGTNSIGEVSHNAEVLKPTVSIITNIGPSHLEGLRDKNGVLSEKIALVESLGRDGVWVKNRDDELLATKEYENIKTISYGIEAEELDFKGSGIRELRSGLEFTVKERVAKVPLLGIHNVYNSLAAIACSSLFMDVTDIVGMLPGFKGTSMRLEVLDTGNFTIINDTYNSNPLSFSCALRALRNFPVEAKRVLVCADMLELGRFSDKMHYDSGRLAAKTDIDYLMTFGERATNIAEGAIKGGMDKNRVNSFQDKHKLESSLRNIIKKGDVVLIKGSRGMKMEEIVNCFITCSTH
ncbi:MAG: UDP-N-acetylmuramoyl-tripeptide--D-alanyl-D-alanine ligase [Candidatus Omnitrophica bacterium]|nr:UDP-N-acetylmuramoyl-tripeptide--D-alanyl-D-alanine ligase [Candidatus Omnitrophota bacterium]